MFLPVLLIPLAAWVWSRLLISRADGMAGTWSRTLILLSGWMVCITEGLSAGYALEQQWLMVAWVAFLLTGILLLKDRTLLWTFTLPAIGKQERWFAGWILLVLMLTGVLACVAYPNNWDSMTYHLTRVEHWMQRQTVIHYATNNVRQVSQPPLAEYWILHILSLGGIDRLANLVQWTAWLISMISIWGILGVWGMSRKVQWSGVLLAAALPMAILQSTSTQNDLLAAAMMLQSVYWAFRVRNGNRQAVWWMLTAFSLAVFTKGSNYIYLLPVLPFAAIWVLRQFGWSCWKPALFGLAVLLVFNGPHWVRNHDTFGRWTGSDKTLVNDSHDPNQMLAVFLQNLAMECQTPISGWNRVLTNAVIEIEKGTGVLPGEPTINWAPSPSFSVGMSSLHEDYTGNLLMVILSIVSLFILAGRYRKHPAVILALMAVSMAVLFSLLLKWQVWHNRLHLPMLLLFIPAVAVALQYLHQHVRTGILIVVAAASIPWLVFNQSRPMVGKESVFRHYDYYQYFFNQPELLRTFLQLAAVADRNQVEKLGWATSGDAWEYPMWRILQDQEPEMRHVLVGNETRVFERSAWQPEGIVSNRAGLVALPRLQCHGRNYYRTYTDGQWAFFLPEPNL